MSSILSAVSLESNRQIKINFNGGYHPLLCYDGLTGDLLKAELRDGTQYCSKDADQFMIPLMQEYREESPSMPLYLRGDCGFASPDLYEACENNDCKYAIRLKQNSTLVKLAADARIKRSFTKHFPISEASAYSWNSKVTLAP